MLIEIILQFQCKILTKYYFRVTFKYGEKKQNSAFFKRLKQAKKSEKIHFVCKNDKCEI